MTSPLRLKVHGLDCAEEVTALRREVGPVVGGEDRLSFDILGGTMQVVGPTPAVTVIEAVGRPAAPGHEPADDGRHPRGGPAGGVVRGVVRRLPVRTVAGARGVEHRPRTACGGGAARSEPAHGALEAPGWRRDSTDRDGARG